MPEIFEMRGVRGKGEDEKPSWIQVRDDEKGVRIAGAVIVYLTPTAARRLADQLLEIAERLEPHP